MPGPARTPKAVLDLRGSRLARDRSEPELPDDIPTPPDWLQGDALTEWERIVPMLYAAGVVRETDRAELAAYCSAWGDYCDLRERLSVEGWIATSGKGSTYLNPTASAMLAAEKRLDKLAQQLGCTPASRSKVDFEKKKEDGDWF